ncbi:hypothetical protein [Paraburkholderia sp. ZP32-5]|uniref:hypothetical protein n=1 Tax=Paraburkholderia sp. ZP32-5 TaxID=2883245 RepID=UPI001F47146B|nr:hypothetical protein [Paraburkholderia sp. ZP32-5]
MVIVAPPRNAVMPARAAFALDYREAIAADCLSAFVIRSESPKPRAGNPAPRVDEAHDGVVGSAGIPGAARSTIAAG